MPYRVRLGPQPIAYLRDVLEVEFPGAKQFFKHLKRSVEEGTIDLHKQCEHASSLIHRIEEDRGLAPEVRRAIIADFKRVIAIIPEAWVAWVEALPPGLPALFFCFFFEDRPPAPAEEIHEIWIFKLSVHAD